MITEQGVVDRVSGPKAVVRIEKSSACAACQSRESCQEGSGREMVIEVANDLGAGEGDRIEISIPGGSFLILSLLVYLLPVAALIAGAVAGGAFAGTLHMNPTFASIVGGCLGIGVTFYALKRLDRSSRAQKEFRPRMTRILLRSDALCRNNDQK
jgi:sigma-E factor negative regulatory protein RseC